MNIKNLLRGLLLISLLGVILFGTGVLGVHSVSAMGKQSIKAYVPGSEGNIILSNNSISSYSGGLLIGYLSPAPGKCTDQPVFTLPGYSNTDNQLFQITINQNGSSSLQSRELDLGRDEFHIRVALVCFISGVGEVGYEDSFTLFVAPEINIGGDAVNKIGEPFGRLGYFVDPGPENSWTLYVNYGDAEGEYEQGWQPLDFNAYSKDFELFHNYANEGYYTVSVRAVDERGYAGESSILLAVEHSPIANAGGPYNILEHGDVLLDASSSSDIEFEIVSYEWDLNNDGVFNDATGVSVPAWFPDDTGGPFLVRVKVTNTQGQFDTASAYVHVSNVDPSLSVCVGGSIDEGQTFISPGSFSDPGYDTWTATVDYGDGSGVQPLPLIGKSFTLSHKYSDDGAYSVEVVVTDDDNGQDTCSVSVTVNDVAPSIDSLIAIPQVVDEGGTVNFSASFSNQNPDDTHTIKWKFGDGNTAAGFLTPTNTYIDNNGSNPYTVELRITDDDGSYAVKTISIAVNNKAPSVSGITGPTSGETGTQLSFSANFSDAGILDPHVATWHWGDGATSMALVSEANGSGSVAGSHIYNTSGDYMIYVEVIDKDGGSGKSVDFQVKVEDPFIPPTPLINMASEASTIEGSIFSDLGGFGDPLSTSWTATVDYGDGSGEQSLELNTDHTFKLEHYYIDNGLFDITVRVTNNYGQVGSASLSLTVENVAPWFTWNNLLRPEKMFGIPGICQEFTR
jgi:hypothetical protein